MNKIILSERKMFSIILRAIKTHEKELNGNKVTHFYSSIAKSKLKNWVTKKQLQAIATHLNRKFHSDASAQWPDNWGWAYINVRNIKRKHVYEARKIIREKFNSYKKENK